MAPVRARSSPSPRRFRIGYAAFDIGTFTTLSTIYALSVAEVHGVRITDPDRRRMLVMAVLASQAGRAIAGSTASKSTIVRPRSVSVRATSGIQDSISEA